MTVTVRRTEDRHYTAAEEGAHPGGGGALSQGCHGIVVVKEDCHGNAAALGFCCLDSALVQAECRCRVWLAELSSGRFGMFGGSWCLPHGESSAQTGCRLEAK